jgi:GNAT superfamily N-acetyltransferase
VIELRAFDPSVDGAAVFDLWTRSIGHAWPVARDDFDEIMGDGLVAVDGSTIVGTSMFSCREATAHLQVILVDDDLQGQGIGARLHAATVAALGDRGVTRVQLAGTPVRYLWPGLPAELRDLRQPLERRGWTFGYTCWDLVRTLADYETPAEVAQSASEVTFRRAGADDRAPLLAFERTHFPQWADDFSSDAGSRTAIVAVDEDGQLVGSLLAADQREPHVWRHLLGDACGSINCVGVDERVQGRGIGTRMVAHACETLQADGVINCHIGWVELLSFYGRLGFQPWREYDRAALELRR